MSLTLKLLGIVAVLFTAQQLFAMAMDQQMQYQQAEQPQYYAQQNTANDHYYSSSHDENRPLRYTDDEPIPKTTTHQQAIPSATNTTTTQSSPENLISLDMKLKYPIILPPKKTVSEHMLLTLTTKEISLSERTPMDLVWVVDTSGSMAGEKIKLLKDTLKYMLTMLSSQDRLAIVRFSSEATRLTPLKFANSQNEQYFTGVIDSSEASGGTNIGAGILTAIEVLRGRVYNDRVSSIFVLSDGQDNDVYAEDNIRNMLSENTDISGYTIHTFGYGYDHDPILMGNIAKMRDGNFYFIEKLTTAAAGFADALGGVATVVAENVAISVRPLQSSLFSHVTIEKGFGGEFIWKKTPEGWYETNIKQFSSGKSKNYVLTLSLGAVTPLWDNHFAESGVAKAVITYNLPGKTEKITKEIDLIVRVTADEEEFKRQRPDSQVLLNYYRVRAGEAIQESSKLAEVGKYEVGKKTLIDLKEELKQSAVNSDQSIIDTIADLDKFAAKMEPETYQQEGIFDMQQNIGSYMKESSNPYSDRGKGYSNLAQSEMVGKAKKWSGWH